VKSSPFNFARKFPIDARFARYALAGSALLAAPGAANAGIVYSGVVNLDVTPGTPLPIDLDSAGGADFSLNVSVNPETKEAWLTAPATTRFLVGPLAFGAPITSANTTSNPNTLFKEGGTYAWTGTSHGYLGVRFTTLSQDYLGWAELTLDENAPGATVNSYAYNDVAGQSITAGEGSAVPEPSSMPLFAAGAAGLAILRRRRKHA
jgi:hypothetical protein